MLAAMTNEHNTEERGGSAGERWSVVSSPGSTQHTEFTLAANYCPPVLNPSTALANAHSVHNESNHLRQNKMLKNSFYLHPICYTFMGSLCLMAEEVLKIHGQGIGKSRIAHFGSKPKSCWITLWNCAGKNLLSPSISIYSPLRQLENVGRECSIYCQNLGECFRAIFKKQIKTYRKTKHTGSHHLSDTAGLQMALQASNTGALSSFLSSSTSLVTNTLLRNVLVLSSQLP